MQEDAAAAKEAKEIVKQALEQVKEAMEQNHKRGDNANANEEMKKTAAVTKGKSHSSSYRSAHTDSNLQARTKPKLMLKPTRPKPSPSSSHSQSSPSNSAPRSGASLHQTRAS
jgi:hypothetical protein